jgi:hypothetical protein
VFCGRVRSGTGPLCPTGAMRLNVRAPVRACGADESAPSARRSSVFPGRFAAPDALLTGMAQKTKELPQSALEFRLRSSRRPARRGPQGKSASRFTECQKNRRRRLSTCRRLAKLMAKGWTAVRLRDLTRVGNGRSRSKQSP